MWVYDESTAHPPDATTRRYSVLRGEPSCQFATYPGDPIAALLPAFYTNGPRPRAHKSGAAATIVNLSGIYVHAKIMLVDDIFLSIGSANMNRRGLFHDGETNMFSIPQLFKADPANPVAELRRRLWAEMLNLPADMAGPLLEDPVAAANLFDRSPYGGNRYTRIGAYPTHLMLGASTGDGLVMNVLQLAMITLAALDEIKVFDSVVDPTTGLETAH